MRATIIHGAGDVRRRDRARPGILEPTDALVRVVGACICGSDLWPYRSMPASEEGARIGHEFLGVIEDVGADVSGFGAGDLVVAPFVWSDGTLRLLPRRAPDLVPPRRHVGPGRQSTAGQGEAVRVPQAQGTLVKLPVGDGLRPPAVAAQPVGRVPHRLPLRPHRRGQPAHHRHRHR